MSTLATLSADPLIRNFAKDASQAAIRPIANFLAPQVQVPDITGRYKIYDAKNRYRRPKTRLELAGKATRLGFTASDGTYTLDPQALDFPIPNAKGMSAETLRYHMQYGIQLLADAAGLVHEAEVIDAALAAAGAGTDSNFTSSSVDPVAILDAQILNVMKAAKNGAPVKVLFGATALQRFRNNANVRGRITAGSKRSSNGSGEVSIQIGDVSNLLFGNPQCDVSLYVEDDAAEGVAESISFLLDTAILIFACNDTPNTMDPSFMKTFVPMGGLMVPGSYLTEDERTEVLKMDWSTEIKVTNSSAVARINATAA